jgi:histidinol-phosphate aminotransferase
MTKLRWRDDEADAAPQRRNFKPSDAVRLHANEHPYPPPPEVLTAITEGALVVNRYPFGNEGPLTGALAQRMGVATEQVLLGAGSNELLYKSIAALGGPGTETAFPHPSYPTFAAAPATSSATAVPVPLLDTGACDAKGLLAAVTERTTCLVVCNPNNPTGGALAEGELASLADELPEHILLLVDEAYFEYTEEFARGGRGALELFGSGRPVVVTRSFSKFFGLAGLRLGYGAVSSPELAAEMRGHIGPSGVSGMALSAGEAALRAEPVFLERLQEQKRERAKLWRALDELGLHPLQSETNFVYCDEPDPGTAGWLAERGVSIRSGASISSPGYMRITVGLPEHNALVLSLLNEHPALERRVGDGEA